MAENIAYDKAEALVIVDNYLQYHTHEKELKHIIDKTIEVVINRHFSKYIELVIEFRSVVYIKVFKVLPFYNPEKDIFTWLYTIARNEIHNMLYKYNKDHVCIDLNDMDIIEYECEKEEDQAFVEAELGSYFPSNRYIIGEELLGYMNLLGGINNSDMDTSILQNEEDIHRFIIFSYFYLKSDVMLMLHAYHTLFKSRDDFGGMVVALSSIHSRLPTPKQLLKLLTDYKVFLFNEAVILDGKVPKELVHLRDSLAEYEITLKNVLAYMDGDKIVDTKLFSA